MMELPPERCPPPYEDAARAQAYRAGYLAWPDDTYKPDPGHKYEREWLRGWADALEDCPETDSSTKGMDP